MFYVTCYFVRNVIANNGFYEHDLDWYMPYDDVFLEESFPEGFVWSAATAAYQVEGGASEGGMS